MKLWVVTLKLPGTGPTGEKLSGRCPVFGDTCTDINGLHHSVAVKAASPHDATLEAEARALLPVSVTRVEEVRDA